MQFRHDMPIKEFAEFAVAENFYVVDVITKQLRVFEKEAVTFCCTFINLLGKYVIEMTNTRTGKHYDDIYANSGVAVFADRAEALKFIGGREEK